MAKPVKSDKDEPKKPYSPPLLLIYGTVQELTKKVGNHGSRDRLGGISNNKTHI